MEDPQDWSVHQRRWRFASYEFDETGRRLIVDGRNVSLEAKPAKVLGILLRRAGETVSKEDLLNAVWPGLVVVEASVPTAIRKLRRALGEDRHDGRTIETVAGVGYRLAVPVAVKNSVSAFDRRLAFAEPVELESVVCETASTSLQTLSQLRRQAMQVLLSVLLLVGALFAARAYESASAKPAYSKDDVASALRTLDVEKVNWLLRQGWDPNTYDKEGNGAVNMVLQRCEWDPAHDRERMVLMIRTLLEAGGGLDHRNVWGDTSYSIAKAPRYCGPDHPVTKMLKAMCYNGYMPIGDRCLASYELDRRRT